MHAISALFGFRKRIALQGGVAATITPVALLCATKSAFSPPGILAVLWLQESKSPWQKNAEDSVEPAGRGYGFLSLFVVKSILIKWEEEVRHLTSSAMLEYPYFRHSSKQTASRDVGDSCFPGLPCPSLFSALDNLLENLSTLKRGCSFFAYNWKLPAYSGAFLLTVDNLSFFTYSWSFLAYSWSFLAYSGRALRDCKQRSLTVSKKAPTVSNKNFPTLNYITR